MTESISKSKLKAKIMEIFRLLEASGEELVVTNHGKPVLRIIPYSQKSSVEELFGSFQGQIAYHEDIDTPTVYEWSEL